MAFDLKTCSITHVGLKRAKNEDCYLTVTGQEADLHLDIMGRMFAVADGMGGHPAGDKAARMACDSFKNSYYSVTKPEKQLYRLMSWFGHNILYKMLLKRMRKALYAADRAIQHYECDHIKCEGLGTTLSVLVIAGYRALIAHVGDSRIYRLRDNLLELLTVDHTFVQDLVDMGEMTRKEADESPMRHVLMEALGRGIDEICVRSEKIKRGDLFLLCSDGLHDMVDKHIVYEILTGGIMLDKKCQFLLDRALSNGGKDNITVVIVQAE